MRVPRPHVSDGSTDLAPAVCGATNRQAVKPEYRGPGCIGKSAVRISEWMPSVATTRSASSSPSVVKTRAGRSGAQRHQLTDRVEGVQRIRGYAQPSADRLQYPRALKHGHLPPLLPQRHCRGQSAYTRAYHRRAPGPAARHVGLRRLTHRAVDQAAGLPPGTTDRKSVV